MNTLLGRLKRSVLENLLRVLERGGQDCGACCLLPPDDVRIGKQALAPVFLFCQVWRWVDLQEGELARLPFCRVSSDDLRAYECCNPYHWARQVQPGSSLCSTSPCGVPYSDCDTLLYSYSACDHAEGSVATGGSRCDSAQQSEGGVSWCTLAYWEERRRVGRLFPVSAPIVEIFQDLPRPIPNSQSMELRALSGDLNPAPSESTVRARDKIGLGVILSLEGSQLSLYNRSNIPVFINSPTLEDFTSTTRQFNVHKILPGYTMVVFDLAAPPVVPPRDPGRRQHHQLDGPYDPHALRLSFGKGWGGKYSRQVITSCPCWLEILLTTPPR